MVTGTQLRLMSTNKIFPIYSEPIRVEALTLLWSMVQRRIPAEAIDNSILHRSRLFVDDRAAS